MDTHGRPFEPQYGLGLIYDITLLLCAARTAADTQRSKQAGVLHVICHLCICLGWVAGDATAHGGGAAAAHGDMHSRFSELHTAI